MTNEKERKMRRQLGYEKPIVIETGNFRIGDKLQLQYTFSKVKLKGDDTDDGKDKSNGKDN